jgi:hypothetical protein
MTSSWLDSAYPPDVRVLTLTELLAVWRANISGRMGANVALGSVAAHEVCRRLSDGKAASAAASGVANAR